MYTKILREFFILLSFVAYQHLDCSMIPVKIHQIYRKPTDNRNSHTDCLLRIVEGNFFKKENNCSNILMIDICGVIVSDLNSCIS
jgi:hypothetical protein